MKKGYQSEKTDFIRKWAGLILPFMGMAVFFIIYGITKSVTAAALLGLWVGYIGTALYLLNRG